ncbi:Glycoside hydrolase family 27 [Penicillium vulpinum]|uniref:Glycoside hydrolase family 27 n=1 Tax=Penicillium vulpinum TaxID=29845 RepID=UPI002546B729|nr:Glycoside hydrolase family 27 [Penicillium vulpinum]KAJ5952664.1 Glycoside hydrolase family 27 [Penicillium vulpinum]
MKTVSPKSWAARSMAGLLALPLLPVHASSGNPSLSPAPPMGFNNWARFMCDLNETLFTETAQSMLDRGLLDVGYDRLTLDDCWMSYDRAKDGSLQWDTEKFPNGIPWLAKFVNSKGFQLGIYEDSGNLTCGGYPGSYQFEEQDAELFASWGIDYLKLDGCNLWEEEGRTIREEYHVRYEQWHQILSAMPKPLIFSNSAPAYFEDDAADWATVMDWVPETAELARHSADVITYSVEGNAWNSIMYNYDFHVRLVRYQQPGYYNDPDFLIPDHPSLSMNEKKSQFALWSSMGAPLIISAYIPALSDEEIAFLSNKALIAVNKDPLSQQSALVSRDGTFDVLARSLENGDRLLTVLNRGAETATTTVSLARLGLSSSCKYEARELVAGEDLTIDSAIKVELDSHVAKVFRIAMAKKCTKTTPTGMVFNTPADLCMTASTDSVTFEKCAGLDSQVWHAPETGDGTKLTLRPLSNDSLCLAATGDKLSLAKCHGGHGTNWEHFMSGHLRSSAGGCLTQTKDQGSISECVSDSVGQIFGLASGISLAKGDLN